MIPVMKLIVILVKGNSAISILLRYKLLVRNNLKFFQFFLLRFLFYRINPEKNFVIQKSALPFDANDEVSLGFKSSISGDFTINIDQADGLFTNQVLFIKDKLLNTIFDLGKGNYTFNTTSGEFNDRFVLHYTNKIFGNTIFKKIKPL